MEVYDVESQSGVSTIKVAFMRDNTCTSYRNSVSLSVRPSVITWYQTKIRWKKIGVFTT